MDDLTTQTSKGAFWNLFSSFTVSAIRFVVTAILARILSPKDFGLLGMATLTIGVVALFGHLGLNAALIQMKDVDDEYLSTGFWASMATGSVLTFLGIAAAPFVSAFFHEPMIRELVCILSINFFISALSSVHSTLLYKELRFKEIALIEIVCTVARVIFILSFAVKGFGVWSFIIGITAERILKTIFFWFRKSWRPKLIFVKEKFYKLFHFGRNLYGASFIGYFNKNMDFIVTGRFLGSIELGYYQFAYNIPHLVRTHITERLSSVLFPVFSKISDDKERAERGFLKTAKFISMITFPVMFGLFFTADHFILSVYGTRWAPAIVPLRILCASGALTSVSSTCAALLSAQGRPDLNLKWSLLFLPISIGLIIGLSQFGLNGVAYAMMILSLLSFVIVDISLRLINSNLKRYFKSLVPATICALFMVTALTLVDVLFKSLFSQFYQIHFVALFIHIILGTAAYTLFAKMLFNDEFKEMISFVMLNFKKKKI